MKTIDLPKIIQELIAAKIPLIVKDNGFGQVFFEVLGFYGCTVLLFERDEEWFIDSYKNQVSSLEDIVSENFDAYKSAKKRKVVSEPDPLWVDLLKKYGFITKKQITVYEELV